jgi:hypothetical protein
MIFNSYAETMKQVSYGLTVLTVTAVTALRHFRMICRN